MPNAQKSICILTVQKLLLFVESIIYDVYRWFEQLNCAKMVSPLHKDAVPVSFGVFVVDIDRRIRACMRYSPSTGTAAAEYCCKYLLLVQIKIKSCDREKYL